MLTELGNNIVQIEPSDWRWSASIVGLSKYFNYHKLDYTIEEDYIEFNEKFIDKKRYLKFAEYFFGDKMHHKIIENLLKSDVLTNEEIKLVNEKLSANSVMKKVMKKVKFNNNKDEILNLIGNNRFEIIKNTFKEGKSLYANFCNKGNLFDEKGNICRIVGYYVDRSRKLGTLSFGAEKEYVQNISTDTKYFDFVPFGFSKTKEAFFINNNFTIKQLIDSNKVDIMIDENISISNFLYKIKESSKFIDYDVEVIKKDRDNNYYETIFIRKSAIEIFKQISDVIYNSIKDDLKVKKVFGQVRKEFKNGKWINKRDLKDKKYWLKIEKIITNNILNGIKLDFIIEKLFVENLDEKATYNYKINSLININQLIYGRINMTKLQKEAYISALKVQKILSNKKNKIRSYEQRLITSLSLRDYDNVKKILLYLSAYTQIKMDFLIDVFENFDENKNLVYTFINTLGEKKSLSNNSNKGEEEK